MRQREIERERERVRENEWVKRGEGGKERGKRKGEKKLRRGVKVREKRERVVEEATEREREREREREMKGGRERRKKIIYLSSLTSVRSYSRFQGMDVASRIYRHRGSHFQFNLLKARQKVIRYFTGAVDRGETAGFIRRRCRGECHPCPMDLSKYMPLHMPASIRHRSLSTYFSIFNTNANRFYE